MRINIKRAMFLVLFFGAVAVFGIRAPVHAQTVTSSAVMQLTPLTVPDGMVGAPYSETITASSTATSTGSFYWSLSGTLPDGLSLNTAASGSSTTIYGTPTTAGQYNFTVAASDQAYAAVQTYTMNIDPAAATTTVMTGTTTTIATTTMTQAQLEAELDSLTVQLMQLEEMIGMNTSSPTASTAPVSCGTATFCRDLTVGDSGSDVLALQQFLNANGAVIASSGPGSPGNETQYFGTLTQTALASWQSMNNISPAQGYFGPVTRAAVEMALSSSSSTQ